jgi:hypothetical protein
MKVEQKANKEEFAPIQILLTLESAEEARAIYAIFNHGPNSTLLGRNNAGDIKDVVGLGSYVGGGSGNEDPVIANGVTYEKFYNPHGCTA